MEENVILPLQNEVNEQEDFYYVRVTQEDEHQAWSSPIWVKGN